MVSGLGSGHNNCQEIAVPEFETVALVLRGGGALGSYQAGVYEALATSDVLPNWVAGISIGAINTALIAGNPPEKRAPRLRDFWETVSSPPLGVLGFQYNPAVRSIDEATHRFINQMRALSIAMFGAPGFFTPRFPSPLIWPSPDPARLSYYDVKPLRATLERLIDCVGINSGELRLSIGAVNVRSGNFTYFDSTTHNIDIRHIIASGSLPPGFPATEIDGEYYWDVGIVSNTPLQWVFDGRPRQDMLAFQVDLWSASGERPRGLTNIDVRQKEIRFSSKTRAATDQILKIQRLRRAFRSIYDRLPPDLLKTPEVDLLAGEADEAVTNVVELIYRSKSYEGIVKDFEFSRRTRWKNIRVQGWTMRAARWPTRKFLSGPTIRKASAPPTSLAVRKPRAKSSRKPALRLRDQGASCEREGNPKPRFCHAVDEPSLSDRAIPFRESRIPYYHLSYRPAEAARARA
jgi:NTE family protein